MEEWLKSLGTGILIGIFAIGAVSIWISGTKMEGLAAKLGIRTGLGHVFAGMFLLAVATSLPELVTSITATVRDEPGLAVFNILGSIVLQTMVLALADFVGEKGALTRNYPSFSLVIQGCGLLFVLAFTVMVIAVCEHWPEQRALSIGGPICIAVIYACAQYVALRAQKSSRWKPIEPSDDTGFGENAEEGKDEGKDETDDAKDENLGRLTGLFLFAAGMIFVAGTATVLSVEQIAERTGASKSFLGFALVSLATSLPEIGTTVVASRRNRGVTAMSNIFGSNAFVLALLGLVAIVHGDGIFREDFIPAIFAAALGMILTLIYLVGMLERRDRTLLRIGIDSWVVMIVGSGGMWVMFQLFR